MAYNEKLAQRIREALEPIPNATEKNMFGGVCFMVNDKMCMGVVKDEMMCRIDPAQDKVVLEKPACRPMDFTGRPMKGYIFVREEGIKSKKELMYWVNLCLDFNQHAKSSKTKSRKR
jgi:TfoX/Sxy family transcriptional regulator of competence genes